MEEINDWIEEINDSKKREEDYFKQGIDINEIYEGECNTPFNILYSNTETMLPALFSNVPRPIIQRRFKDEDPLGKYASQAAQRVLEYLIDTDIDGEDKFETAMLDATQDGLLPGRGITTVKYDDETEEFEVEEGEQPIPPQISNQNISADSRSWDKVYFGYAKKWSKMPWVAYEEYLDEEEAKAMFGAKSKHLTFTEGRDQEEDDDRNDEDERYTGKKKTTPIYQIWDKADRKVKYVSPGYLDAYLRVDDDPLELTGFFNCPEPLTFVRKSNNLVPTAPYTLYEQQASELNEIQRRLTKVIQAIKVRGVYDPAMGDDLGQILKGEDNELIPSDKGSILAEGGFDKSIWMLPIEKLVAVAQQLYQARESCKRVIYEITGISDIVRGQSAASETLGAQKIKEAWGTMRLKRLQKRVQHYALDTMRMMLEVAVLKFDVKTWKQITGMPLPMKEEKDQAMQFMKQAKAQGMPEDSPQVQKAQEVMKLPSWEDVLGLLQNDYWRSYRLDIETNSTLDVEATEDKQNVAEFMNAFAQLMNGMFPMVEKGVMPFDAAKSMMLAIVKRFRFGREVEEQLKEMQQPKPQADPKAEAEQKKFQAEQQKFGEKQKQFEEQQKQAGDQLDEQFRKLEYERLQFDFEKKLAQEQAKMNEQMVMAKQDLDQEEAAMELKNIIKDAERSTQSMLDKHKAHVEKCMSGPEEKNEKPAINIVNQMPEGNKSISIEREDGMITGAKVDG